MNPSRLRRAARNFGTGLVDLLYPARCFTCRSPATEPGLCASCQDALRPVRAPFCSICGEPYDGEIVDGFICSNCTGREFDFEFAIAAYLATGPARSLIHDFKYHRRIAVRGVLAELAATALDDPRLDGAEGWLLVPVPLHRRRHRERGYNQAAEIAVALGHLRELPVCEALQRHRYTSAQAQLVRAERLANLAESFSLRPSPASRHRVEGAKILLIDDVFTTGATADACARVLREKGGAEKVVVATVARG